MRFHKDDRRRFYGDIFGNTDGDINVVFPKLHVPIAWHRHQRQSDQLFIVQGVLRVRYFFANYWSDEDGVERIMANTPGERPVVLLLAGYWHGYEALTNDTIVLQFNGPGKWDGTDEERMSLEEMPWTPTP